MPDPGPVALFSAELSGNGIARNTAYLAQALMRKRAQVEVVCLAGGALADELPGAPLTLLGRGGGPRSLSLASRVPALRRWIADRRPSLMVSMGNHAHLCLWAALRGADEVGRAYRISNDPLHPGEPVWMGQARLLGLRLVAADADRLTCVSGRLARQPVFDAARRQGRVVVTPNGVDIEAVRARAAESSSHPWAQGAVRFVAAVGRIHPQKNYEALIEALALVRAHGRDLRLSIIGGGSHRRVAALKSKAQRCGVAGAVRLEGEMRNPFPLLSRACAFALPSLWEGASNSLLEALACEIPVVAATTAGNAAEVLEGGRFGRLCAPEPAALARALADQAYVGPARVLPAGRAQAFGLRAASDRLADVLLAARAPQAAGGQQLNGEPAVA